MFKLRATFTDGHSVTLDERYSRQFEAERAGCNYIRDYSDPCGLGIRCTQVAIIQEGGAPYVAPIVPRTAEQRMPPHPRGVVETLRERGHTVTVRENRNGSLRYAVDSGRETDALTMSNRYGF